MLKRVFTFKHRNFRQFKKYDKNSTTKNWRSDIQYKKYDKTCVDYRVVRHFYTDP